MTSYPQPLYCNSLTEYSRWLTREVRVGDLYIGGTHPIRLQSMTTTDTMDTAATVAQAIRMIDAGCELVRITAPSLREAQNLEHIRNELRRKGYRTPLCADIHFTPNAAETAARIVEKVRINPGNYADKKRFERIEYTDSAYAEELDRIRERFTPLVSICKEYGTAMRIGTNHGSLSDRIMSRYGDTAWGMVQSAMEFIRICQDENFHDIVLSMKSSNPQVMVHAYRLLVLQMKEHRMNYPLHLGVTEAGDGEDGRIKSAVGIGALLEDGLGDTVRVSLTEEPEYEIPVARLLVSRYTHRAGAGPKLEPIPNGTQPFSESSYRRRKVTYSVNFGYNQVPRVIGDLNGRGPLTPAALLPLGYRYDAVTDKWNIGDQACDYIYTGTTAPGFALPGTLGVILDYAAWKQGGGKERHYPFFDIEDHANKPVPPETLHFVRASLDSLPKHIDWLKEQRYAIVVIETDHPHGMAALRLLFAQLYWRDAIQPVVIRRQYTTAAREEVRLHAATDIGALLLDGLGDGVWLHGEQLSTGFCNSLAFGILQATRTRISKTEYISCPSCGRTLFDLQETTARIRARTSHLKGVKIGIMGCIVNGPGEMADADYGYVGTGPGKITLYKGKEVVKRNVPSANAVDELIALIRDNGDWIEAPAADAAMQADRAGTV
jgi:(E)-4-hydroxy-3-methylbut-2-enyl-diphosphate synthase